MLFIKHFPRNLVYYAESGCFKMIQFNFKTTYSLDY